MTSLSQEIIGKIKHDHIAPVPRWHFLLKSYAYWLFLGMSIILGSLSFSVIVHILRTGDLGMLKHLQGNIFTSSVMLLPYFWFFSLCVCELVAYYNWKHTRGGYRFRRRWIMFSSVAASVLFGSGLYAMGMGEAIDETMARSIPFYDQSKHSARRQIWMQPERGLLVGKIIQVGPQEGVILIEDEGGNSWMVKKSVTPLPPPVGIKKGKVVKIVGSKEKDYVFSAKEIRRCGDCRRDEDQEDDDD